jgi:hypothetical protein
MTLRLRYRVWKLRALCRVLRRLRNQVSAPSSAAAGMPHAAKTPPAAVKPCVPSIVVVPRPKK